MKKNILSLTMLVAALSTSMAIMPHYGYRDGSHGYDSEYINDGCHHGCHTRMKRYHTMHGIQKTYDEIDDTTITPEPQTKRALHEKVTELQQNLNAVEEAAEIHRNVKKNMATASTEDMVNQRANLQEAKAQLAAATKTALHTHQQLGKLIRTVSQ
ncbi:MAG TPA: hypothetical protein VLG50_07380 [Candidatus Saccharimonadales bacterium]|nr:hypothetical protein [Candidatus Saccharimonadales bacterium]